jgi:hypothetical protein
MHNKVNLTDFFCPFTFVCNIGTICWKNVEIPKGETERPSTILDPKVWVSPPSLPHSVRELFGSALHLCTRI